MSNDTNYFHEGDIYRWSWNDEILKRLDYKNSAGTLYWCCSRIGIVKNGVLVDTYWHDGSEHNKIFSRDKAEEELIIQFVANINDIVSAQEHERCFYLDDDCLDLNHPNSTRGNFYIRKGAVKNIDKIKRILERRKKFLQRSIGSVMWDISRIDEHLKSVSTETYFSVEKDVSLSDHSYQDESQ